MKRGHRRWHRRAWLLLLPVLAWLLLAAAWSRSPAPASSKLPAALANVAAEAR